MRTLLAKAGSEALARDAWNRKAFDDGFRVMALDWMGSHQADVARERSLAILRNPDSEPLRIQAIRVLGRVKDKPDGLEVLHALIKIAEETSYWARDAAIQALDQLGNKAAIPYLQPITSHAPGGIRGTASRAVADLAKSP